MNENYFSPVQHPSHPDHWQGSLACHMTQFEQSDSGLILGLHPVNERHRYNLESTLWSAEGNESHQYHDRM